MRSKKEANLATLVGSCRAASTAPCGAQRQSVLMVPLIQRLHSAARGPSSARSLEPAERPGKSQKYPFASEAN